MPTGNPVRAPRPTERERFLKAVLESATDFAIISLDLDGMVTSWNTGAERILGWTAEEICGRPADVFFTPEDRQAGIADKEMQAALDQGRGIDERWHLRKDGTRFWASGEMMPLTDEDGTLQGFIKILRDRTGQRHAGEALRRSEEFLRSVLASSDDCIKVLDLDARLEFMSEGGRRVMEVDDFRPLEGCSWPSLWEGPGHEAAKAAVASAVAGGTGRFTGFAKTAKGTPKWWDVQVTPIPGPDGSPEKLLSISRDITEQHATQEATASQNERLALLAEAASGLISGRDPDEVVRDIFRAAADRLRIETCFHFALGENERSLRLESYIGISPELARELGHLSFGEAVCGRVAETRMAAHFEDVQSSHNPAVSAIKPLGIRAYSCHPLVAQDRFLGTLSFGSRSRERFSTEEIAFFGAISNHVAAIKERQRAERAVQASEARWRGLFEGMQEGFFVGHGVRDESGRVRDIRFVEVNPAFEALTGLNDVTGRTIRQAIPGIDEDLLDTYARVIETGEPTRFEIFVPQLAGRWYEARARRDGKDAIVVLFLDITERKRGEEALAASEQRLKLAQAAGHVGTFEVDIDSGVLTGSDEFFRLWGFEPEGTAPAVKFEQGIVPEDRQVASEPSCRRAGTSPRDVEYRVRRADTGEIRWLARRAEFVRDGNGKPIKLLGTVHDVTDAKAAETRRLALIELGDRLRDVSDTAEIAYAAAEIMGRTLGVSRAGYGTVDPVRETVSVERDWTAPGIRSLAGVRRFSDYGSYVEDLKRGDTVIFADARHDPRTAANADALEAIDVRSLVNLPLFEHGRFVAVFYLNHAEPRSWKSDELAFVRNVADRTRAAIERVRAEERQRLLNFELSHRMKNTLAMVQAVAAQTLRNARTVDEARESLADRLIALSKAHDILLEQTDEKAGLASVVKAATSLHNPDQVRTSGPNLQIGPKTSLSLSLMLHELATNAAKYGALSVRSGCVRMDWSVRKSGCEDVLDFTWREQGGPPVQPPSRKGFGSRLIQRGLAGQIGGEVELAYEPTGVICKLSAPLAAVQSE
jgi:PAS domain S-box-containing protein